ncbi:MAG: 1,4-alpha-glucan branching protein GlgB [Gammaproteobacteria bacterium]|nr:1,4-alpha-glucan branching protein GlgB [Gammaproteobacteria bacterium]
MANWIDDLAVDRARIADGTHHDPHGVLGLRERGGVATLLVYLPAARSANIEGRLELTRVPGSDFFHWQGPPNGELPRHPRICWRDSHDAPRERVDPYSFLPTFGARDLTAFSGGHEARAWQFLGAQCMRVDEVDGVRFAVWAPNAERVSVVGPFCDWDGRRLPLRSLGGSGVWELFVPGLGSGEFYKFELRHRLTGAVVLKTDPYGRATELRPGTASIVCDSHYGWGDGDWLRARRERDWLHAPMSIYEVHAGSWRQHGDGRFYNYRELAAELIPYVRAQGFTHVELLPVTEHPLDDSWGYQTTGYFAPTSRHGSPDELRHFIDQCHQAGIGVLLDWVPGHFPRDAHGLARFDGTALYEYEDPRKGEHADWGTLIFNYDRREVRSFLLSSACYWLEEFHFDGLRVDAVASMIYLDFGRRGNFVPNRHGGRENLEAIDFLRSLNATTHARNPGTVTIAEESTDWPQVSRPTDAGGLGFSMKWNMGWMHDTLDYFKEDSLYRRHHHQKLSFGMMYAYSENFVLPFSHDEVVHLKRSLLGRMPGDRWQQLANLRALYTYMWAFPGKKLLFMGGEFAHPWEWNFRAALPWWLTDHAEHAGVQRAIADLNRLYAQWPALHRYEFEPRGFSWLDCDDASHSTLSFARWSEQQHLVVALNFTPVPRRGYRLGVPHDARYREVFNSDSGYYGGSNLGNGEGAQAEAVPYQGQPHSIVVTLPPLAGVIFAPG